ncbi:PhzF family phenazine biosynthesis protein [Rubrivirga marina]|uniref:Oxidoreductase n=1 Tax=Rubrivirga marina TaxID=1196024 RepID=A0A271IXY0_9BACT|nr:PhzF family phenazine biosynthesis protein [Rubrivirga marina]PAP75565.1 oxidoreductase [Rubrivirga marina]
MIVTVVDAFAERPFEGNPAAVCLLDAPAAEDWMRGLAAEMNLSETAFLTPGDDGAFNLRWLTPEVEVDLCGHATLASAHLLYEVGHVGPEETVRFDTRSGRLTVRQSGERTYTMDFPATPPEAADLDGVAEAFGVEPVWTGRSRFDGFVVLESEAAVRGATPDLGAVAGLDARGVILTARADESSPYDVVSRFFAPGAGVPEDPVTGSAHCAIGPHWATELGRDEVSCFQASRRGGHVGVRVVGDRVELTGHAVTVHRAELAPGASP